MRDYYEVLGVAKNANQDDVKKAFRKKAHELHPDKGGDAEQFKQVNEAYQVLGDEKKRAQYDQFGHAAFQNGGTGGSGGFGGFGANGVNINMDDLGDFGDILGSMFGFGGGQGGARGGRGGQSRGKDLQMSIAIDFMDTIRGAEREISVRTLGACEECKGSGAVGGKTTSCATCGGRGRVAQQQRTPFGVIQTAAACSACRGRGVIPEAKCPACSGAGVHAVNRTLQMRIPAGIADGETIRLSGQGEAAPYGGQQGDLYVEIRVRAHPKFRRDGNDLHSEARVPVTLFFLGGKTTVETVDEEGDLEVPSGTAAGTVFRIRGKGVPFLHGRGRGDLFVTVVPEVPKKLTKEQRKLLESLRDVEL